MNMKDTNNWQIMCASDAEEFYYEGTDELVNEGDAVISEGVSKVRNKAKVKIINP